MSNGKPPFGCGILIVLVVFTVVVAAISLSEGPERERYNAEIKKTDAAFREKFNYDIDSCSVILDKYFNTNLNSSKKISPKCLIFNKTDAGDYKITGRFSELLELSERNHSGLLQNFIAFHKNDLKSIITLEFYTERISEFGKRGEYQDCVKIKFYDILNSVLIEERTLRGTHLYVTKRGRSAGQKNYSLNPNDIIVEIVDYFNN